MTDRALISEENILDFCQTCKNRVVNKDVGIVCGLTNEKPLFDDSCEFYDPDAKEKKYVLERRLAAVDNDKLGDHVDFKLNQKMGIWSFLIGIGITIVVYNYYDEFVFVGMDYGLIITGWVIYWKGRRQEEIYNQEHDEDE